MVEEFFQGSQIFQRESNFPEGVKFSHGSQIFPRGSNFPEGVKFCLSLSHKATNDKMTTSDRPKCSPRPVGFAAGKNVVWLIGEISCP